MIGMHFSDAARARRTTHRAPLSGSFVADDYAVGLVTAL